MSDVKQHLMNEMEWRGLIHQSTIPIERVTDQLQKDAVPVVYCGIDPTANSLHAGHLVALLNLARWQKAGCKPLVVVGGGTGFIGDPSGKSEERSLLTREALDANLAGMEKQIRRFLDFSHKEAKAEVINNMDWLDRFSALDFLRDIGKHFTVNRMMEKESVRARLEDRDQGISYTEFSYMLLQATDFLHLFDQNGCKWQIGGSDQYGNITAGIDLIRRKRSEEAFGVTFPLITRSDGKKFGKTEEGTVWLAPERTSPFEFFQYWINVPDSDAVAYLKIFTEMGKDEIEGLEKEAEKAPEKRIVQNKLASELTEQIHGKDERVKAEKATATFFSGKSSQSEGGDFSSMDEKTLLELFKEAPSSTIEKSRLSGEGLQAVELLAESTLWKSRGEVRRAISGGGVYLNGSRVSDIAQKLTAGDLIHDKYLVLRKGKKHHYLMKCE